jgi:hypothetical protein
MIHYSAYPDLYKVMEMFSKMSQEDKKFLFFDNQHFFVKLTTLHYDLIKGRCIMLVNEEGTTIGFVSTSLDHDEHIFLTEMYVMPEYRQGSLPILLEMFTYLKRMYMRPIRFVVHLENNRMQRLAEFIKAKVTKSRDVLIEYLVQN